jgi:Transposase, Mutator family/HEAT repeats
MQQNVAIKSLPQAIEILQEMNVEGYSYPTDYRQAARQAIADLLESRMQNRIDSYLDDLARRGGFDRRNGSYTRHLLTEIGNIELCIPRTRKFNPVTVIEKFARRAPQVERLIMACFLLGLSTRKVSKALLPILGERISPSTVSRVAKVLDSSVASFHKAGRMGKIACPSFLVPSKIHLKKDGQKLPILQNYSLFHRFNVACREGADKIEFFFGTKMFFDFCWQRAMAKISNKEMENIINELNKSFRAISLYPPGHPALRTTLERTFHLLVQNSQGTEQLEITTSRNCFLLDDKPFLRDNPSINAFSKELFRRRMKKIFILKDVTVEELESFFSLLTIDPAQLQEQGGIEAELARRRVRNIWANEIRFERLEQEYIEDDEVDFPEIEPEPIDEENLDAEQQLLYALLRKLSSAKSNEQFSETLTAAMEPAKQLLAMGRIDSIKTFIFYLGSCCFSSDRGPGIRELSRKGLVSLADDNVIEYLLDELASADGEQALTTSLTLKAIGSEAVVPHFLTWYTEKAMPYERENIINNVGFLDDAAIPAIEKMLHDPRREVVRLMIQLLGRIGSAAAVRMLVKACKHPDHSIALGAVSSLGRIRSPQVYIFLTRLMAQAHDDVELGKLIIENFGLLHEPANADTLEKIIEGTIPLPALVGTALIALARLGGENSVETIAAVLSKKGKYSSPKFRNERLAATQALGIIGDSNALQILGKAACKVTDTSVQQACWKAISTIDTKFNRPAEIESGKSA